jgi:hypothetical protein
MSGMAPARYDQDLVQSDIDQGMQGVVDHGFVVHRQQVLVGDLGQGVEAGACAACEGNAFHGCIGPVKRRNKVLISLTN